MRNYIFYPGIILHDIVLLLVRALFSLELIIVHGIKKFEELPTDVPNPFGLSTELNYGIAVLSNTLFPILLILGFLSRLAVIPIVMITLTGYFVVHGSDPLPVRDIPFMYSLVGLFLLFAGAGKYSVDYWLYKRYWA
jgi:putative oxidoreductase